MNSVYTINKGINKSIEFKGLKAQYIGYLGIGVLLLLIIFAILYIAGVNMIACVILIAILGTALFMVVYKLSNTYGEYGLQKKMAARRLPVYLSVRSRITFLALATPTSKNNF